MKIKRWNDFLSYIKESKEELDYWNLDEDDIKDYLRESIDEGYVVEVRYGFLGQESVWNWKEQRTHYAERFTKKMLYGENTPVISIIITGEEVTKNDVSENLRFAYSIITEEADADIIILDGDGEIGEIDGIIAKGGLFFTDTWNKVVDKDPEINEVEGCVEFLVKKKETVKITYKQLVEYYNWCSYELIDDKLYIEYDLEDLSDLILASDSNYKDLLIDKSGIWDNYFGSDYQPDITSLFQYNLNKENEVLAVKALIKESGGLKSFIGYIGDECDDEVYDRVKEMTEDQIIEYLLKERFYNTLKVMATESEIIGDIKQSYGDWSSSAHAYTNLDEIHSEFDSILDDNFTYKKETREVEKKSKFNKDENGNWRTYTEVDTFYKIEFSNDWIEESDFEDLKDESLKSIFREYCYINDLTRYELKPNFSDYGDVDNVEWNKDIKSDLMRFLNK